MYCEQPHKTMTADATKTLYFGITHPQCKPTVKLVVKPELQPPL